MLVSTQDGVYTATRHAHNVLRVTTEAPDNEAMQKLQHFIGSTKTADFVFCTDQEFVEFLGAHVQDIQYTSFP